MDLTLVLEVEVLVERENMAPSFQIPLPSFMSPGGCFSYCPHLFRFCLFAAPMEQTCLLLGVPDHSSTMDARVSDELGLMTSPGAGGRVSSTRSFL